MVQHCLRRKIDDSLFGGGKDGEGLASSERWGTHLVWETVETYLVSREVLGTCQVCGETVNLTFLERQCKDYISSMEEDWEESLTPLERDCEDSVSIV